MPKNEPLSYGAAELRRHDPDRFLTALFAPADRREALFALYAFNLEIARTREVVTEPMLGQIRLQWWRDSIDGLYAGDKPRHEVLGPLAGAVHAFGLDQDAFHRLIDAREADLTDEPPADLQCMLSYADVTSTPLMRLALQILGADGDAERAAGHQAAIAYALSGLLRAVPFHARGQRLYLPVSFVEAEGVDLEQLWRGQGGAPLRAVVRAVGEEAWTRLERCRSYRTQVARAAVPALLLATAAESNLRALRRADWDVFDPRVQMPHPLKQIRMTWRALLGRY